MNRLKGINEEDWVILQKAKAIKQQIYIARVEMAIRILRIVAPIYFIALCIASDIVAIFNYDIGGFVISLGIGVLLSLTGLIFSLKASKTLGTIVAGLLIGIAVSVITALI